MTSAGCRWVELFDEPTGMPFPMLLMYPSDTPERPEILGPYSASVALDAPFPRGRLPLVIVSHGTGGSHLTHRNLAAHLARHGYVVAVPEHPRNNRNNNELAGTAVNLANRPRHVRSAIDWAFSTFEPSAVVIIGHSLGGYTALAVSGGNPTAFPNETPNQQPQAIDVDRDHRVNALVLLAPATVWFMAPGALDSVRLPILMLTGSKDTHTPAFHAEIVKQGVPDKSLVEHIAVENAGHFSFLSPFPAAMTSPTFLPSRDPDGFDRIQFHQEMYGIILEFLGRVVDKRTASV
ncbi:MAG: alpha/beta fold hydrolase [Bryobacteraceae bacterium]